jgi:hypothetical protein
MIGGWDHQVRPQNHTFLEISDLVLFVVREAWAWPLTLSNETNATISIILEKSSGLDGTWVYDSYSELISFSLQNTANTLLHNNDKYPSYCCDGTLPSPSPKTHQGCSPLGWPRIRFPPLSVYVPAAGALARPSYSGGLQRILLRCCKGLKSAFAKPVRESCGTLIRTQIPHGTEL